MNNHDHHTHPQQADTATAHHRRPNHHPQKEAAAMITAEKQNLSSCQSTKNNPHEQNQHTASPTHEDIKLGIDLNGTLLSSQETDTHHAQPLGLAPG
jgi:hypothetical protein